jgi:hypothetical protein
VAHVHRDRHTGHIDYPRGTQVWEPLPLDGAREREISLTKPFFIVSIVARRKPGLTPQQVQADMSRLTESIRSEYSVHLTDEASPVRAQSHPHGQFALPGSRSSQQQIGNVHTRNQKQECNCATKSCEGRAKRGRQLVLQRYR